MSINQVQKRKIRRILKIHHLFDNLERKDRRSWTYRIHLSLTLIKYQFLPFYGYSVPKWRLILRKLSGKRTLPDFAMIAPVKSGSSDLTNHLLFHPCIVPPLTKEIWSPDPESWRPHYPTLKQMSKAAEATDVALTGFLGPFLHNPLLLDNYYRVKPNAKIIITLRDPVARAYSHWKWELTYAKNRGIRLPQYFQRFDSFVDMALELFPDFPIVTVGDCPFLQTGIYYKAVELWIQRFGRNNVLLIDADSYFKDGNAVLNQIQNFLNIPRVKIPRTNSTLNKSIGIFDPPTQETQRKLTAFYEPYNMKLWEIIGKDFDWNRYVENHRLPTPHKIKTAANSDNIASVLAADAN